MRLYDRLPEAVTYKDREYLLDLSFRKVLAVTDLLEEPIPEEVKLEIALELLVKGRHPKDAGLLIAIFDLLKSDKPPKKKQKVLDLQKDWQYIYAGFRQAYGINLFVDDLHYLEFTALLNSLPSDTRMSQIIDIRTRPVPQVLFFSEHGDVGSVVSGTAGEGFTVGKVSVQSGGQRTSAWATARDMISPMVYVLLGPVGLLERGVPCLDRFPVIC